MAALAPYLAWATRFAQHRKACGLKQALAINRENWAVLRDLRCFTESAL